MNYKLFYFKCVTRFQAIRYIIIQKYLFIKNHLICKLYNRKINKLNANTSIQYTIISNFAVPLFIQNFEKENKKHHNLYWNLINMYMNLIQSDLQVVFSPFSIYKTYFNKQVIYKEYNTEILRKIIERQKILSHYENNKSYESISNVLVVIDDPTITFTIINSDENIHDIIMNGKYYNITLILQIHK